MKFRFEVLVTLKDGLADPAGKAVEASLPSMGWTNVTDVHVGKHIRLDVEAPEEAEARRAGRGDRTPSALQSRDRGLPHPGDSAEAPSSR